MVCDRLRACLGLIAVAVLAAPAPGQRTAQLPWWDRAPERKVGHYWIKTDLPPEEANRLARHLNLMYEEFSRRLASLPQRAPEKLNVMIFSRQREYHLVLQQKFGINAMGTGGIFFVNDLGTALALWTGGLSRRRVEHVAQHEGFHQFAWSRFGNDLPIWVNEGLAEFFGEAVLLGDRLVLGQSTPRVIDGLKDAIEDGRIISFRELLTMSSAEWGAALRRGDAQLQYDQSWSMVQFLVYGDDGRYQGAFEHYLRMVNRGVSSEEAFIRAFGPDIQAFEDRWKKVALTARPSAFLTAMERAEFLAEGALALSRRGEVPESLEALRAALQAIGFTHTLAKHGRAEVLRADDPSLFDIPEDDLSADPPRFVVEKPNLALLPRRLRIHEEKQPHPCEISTDDLRPRNIRVVWTRDEETFDFGYEIEVR